MTATSRSCRGEWWVVPALGHRLPWRLLEIRRSTTRAAAAAVVFASSSFSAAAAAAAAVAFASAAAAAPPVAAESSLLLAEVVVILNDAIWSRNNVVRQILVRPVAIIAPLVSKRHVAAPKKKHPLCNHPQRIFQLDARVSRNALCLVELLQTYR